MTPTWIGLLLSLIGAVLMVRSSVLAMFGLVLAASLFGGSAAINLPALGGASITPAYFALGLLAVRLALADRAILSQLGPVFRENLALAGFCLYSAASALILPKIFEGSMNLVPMQPFNSTNLFATAPLAFSTQNITAAVYMIGALVAAVAAGLIASRQDNWKRILSMYVWLTWGHCALGLLALALTAAGQTQVIEFVRNASYAQLSHEYEGFIRITGFFPEASSFAGFGFPLLILMTEAWLRDLMPKRTGPAALAIAIILLISTSSTAYLCLAVYAAIMVLRFILLPTTIAPVKVLQIGSLAFVAAVLVLLLVALSPQVANEFGDMLTHMTVGKADSSSGQQRQFWAQQGLTAFQGSFGLGVGAGTFRSSNLFTAIIGSVGVVGLLFYVIYLLNVLKPSKLSTFGKVPGEQAQAINLGGAFGITAVVSLTAALATAPSPVPAVSFCLFAGLALAFRRPTVGRVVMVPVTDRPRLPARSSAPPHLHPEPRS